MHFADLTRYQYLPQPHVPASTTVLNVGWLDEPHAFPIGHVPQELIDRLTVLITRAITQPTGGGHWCTLPHADGASASGSGEIIVVGSDGTHFHAPQLIHHYVTAHRYQPPQAFIDAVSRTAHITWREARRDDLCLACGQRMVCDHEDEEARFLGCPACHTHYVRLSGPPGPRVGFHNRSSKRCQMLLDSHPVSITDRDVERGEVAGAHARIEQRQAHTWIVDLRGDTQVNGKPVPGEQPLAHGDTIASGDFYVFYVEQ